MLTRNSPSVLGIIQQDDNMTTVTVNLAAQEQAAMHRTQLLLARCRSCRPPCAPMAYDQASWHARQQTDFLAWLDAGGFAQIHPDQSKRQQAARRDRATTANATAATGRDAGPAAAPQCAIENSGMAPLFSVP
jgi:hypothetical protein